MRVKRLEPSRRDALTIGQEHEDVRRSTAAGELDRQGTQECGLQLKIGDDADTGELGELRQERGDCVGPGMDRARKRDRLAGELFPVNRSAGIHRRGFLREAPSRPRRHARERCAGSAQSLYESAPAGWHSTVQRLFPRRHVGAPLWQSITTRQIGRPRETTERTPEAAKPARLKLSGLLSHLGGMVPVFYYSINTLASAPEDVRVALALKGQVYAIRRVTPVLAVVRSSADLGGRGASNAGCSKRVPGRAVLATAAGGKPRGRA